MDAILFISDVIFLHQAALRGLKRLNQILPLMSGRETVVF